MQFFDDLSVACRAISLPLQCEYNRTKPRYEVALMEGAEYQRLNVVLGSEGESGRVIDHDPERVGMLFEIAQTVSEREPKFDLWLKEVRKVRYLVSWQQENWILTYLPDGDESQTVRDALEAGVLDSEG